MVKMVVTVRIAPLRGHGGGLGGGLGKSRHQRGLVVVSAAGFAHAAVVKYVTSHKKRIKQQRNGAEFADGALLHFLLLLFLLLLGFCGCIAVFFSNDGGGCRLFRTDVDGRWDRRGRQHAFFAPLLLVWLLLLRWSGGLFFLLFGIAAAASQIRR